MGTTAKVCYEQEGYELLGHHVEVASQAGLICQRPAGDAKVVFSGASTLGEAFTLSLDRPSKRHEV